MIEQYPYILDYGISPSCYISSLDSSGVVVGTEGILYEPTPVPPTDEVHGQTKNARMYHIAHSGMASGIL